MSRISVLVMLATLCGLGCSVDFYVGPEVGTGGESTVGGSAPSATTPGATAPGVTETGATETGATGGDPQPTGEGTAGPGSSGAADPSSASSEPEDTSGPGSSASSGDDGPGSTSGRKIVCEELEFADCADALPCIWAPDETCFENFCLPGSKSEEDCEQFGSECLWDEAQGCNPDPCLFRTPCNTAPTCELEDGCALSDGLCVIVFCVECASVEDEPTCTELPHCTFDVDLGMCGE